MEKEELGGFLLPNTSTTSTIPSAARLHHSPSSSSSSSHLHHLLNGSSSILSNRVTGSFLTGPNLTDVVIPRAASASTPDPANREEGRAKIGLLGCIIIIIGCVLGSGIFAAPEEILKSTGNASMTLLVWAGYGAIALLAALCYAELGCTFPQSGGDYTFLNACFGPLPAFLFIWISNLFVTPMVVGIMGMVAAKYVIFPNLPQPSNAWGELEIEYANKSLSIIFIMILSFLNCKNPKVIGKSQIYLMSINILTISLVIVCGIIVIGRNKGKLEGTFELKLPGKEWDKNTLALVTALLKTSFSYFGYTFITYITEELRNPKRDLLVGVCVSIPLVVAVNLIVNFSYLSVLPPDELRGSTTIVDNMFRKVLPEGRVQNYTAWIGTTLVAVAVLGGMSSIILTTSRIAYTGARNHHFPSVFMLVDQGFGTPIISIIFTGVFSSVYVMTVEIPELMMVAAYCETLFSISCINGLIYMRIKHPNLPRPIRLPLIIPILVSLISSFIFLVPIFTSGGSGTVWAQYKPVLFTIGGILTGVPVYYALVVRTNKCLSDVDGKVMRFFQKLWLLLPDEVDEVLGGKEDPAVVPSLHEEDAVAGLPEIPQTEAEAESS